MDGQKVKITVEQATIRLTYQVFDFCSPNTLFLMWLYFDVIMSYGSLELPSSEYEVTNLVLLFLHANYPQNVTELKYIIEFYIQ